MGRARCRAVWAVVPVAFAACAVSSISFAYEPWPDNVVSWKGWQPLGQGSNFPRYAYEPEVSCYDKVYVPAIVKINTRGRLVSPESFAWEQGDTQWRRVRHPAVYVQTRKIIEADHFTLVPAACRNVPGDGWDIQDRTR